MLLGSIAHATGFAIVGTLVYLALRRFGPAAGSLAAGSSIVIMAFGLVDRPRALASLVGPGSAGIGTSDVSLAAARHRGGRFSRCDFRRKADRARDRSMAHRSGRPHRVFGSCPLRAESSFSRFLGDLARELRPTSAGLDRTGGAGRNGSRWGSSPACASVWPGSASESGRSSVCEREAGRSTTAISMKKSRSCARSCPARASGRRPRDNRAGDAGHDRLAAAALALAVRLARLESSRAPRGAGHELAHVCRGDFLAGLVAQLSLASALLSSPGALAGRPPPA